MSSVPGVLIIELDFSHDWCVVPVTEDDERQAIIDVSPQLRDLLWKILFLTVHHQQCPYKHTETELTVDLSRSYSITTYSTNQLKTSTRQNSITLNWTPTILTGIKARDWCTQDLNKVAIATKVLIHVSKVSVNMITIPAKQAKNNVICKMALKTSYEMLPSTDSFPSTDWMWIVLAGCGSPVKRIILHAQVVSGEVARWVA